MANRTVLKVNLTCNKCRKVALQSITQIEGIEMVSINKKEQTITVEGDADPVCIANQLKRKFKCATIIFVGPPPKPPQPPNPPKEKKNDDPPKEKTGNGKPKSTPPSQKPVDPPTAHNPFDPPYFIPVPVPAPCIIPYSPCKPVQPCCCADCSSRWDIPCHPPQPHTEVYVYNEENPGVCTIS